MEIVPGVHWLQLGHANAYLCEGEEGLALVDSGIPRKQRRVFDYIRGLGRDPAELRYLVITHADWDHAGSAAAIQAETGATVYAGPETARWLATGRFPRHLPQPLQLLAGVLGRYPPLPQRSIEPVEEGDTLPILDGLQAMATPGHTPDHYSFYSPRQGVLFCGDVLDTRRSLPRLSRSLLAADMELLRASARRLLRLTPALFACGHGVPCTEHTVSYLMGFLKEIEGK